MEIINPIVTHEIQEFYQDIIPNNQSKTERTMEFKSTKSQNKLKALFWMKQIGLYLQLQIDILTKKLFFSYIMMVTNIGGMGSNKSLGLYC